MAGTSKTSAATRSDRERGRLVSTLLTGSWRESPLLPTLSEDQLSAIILPLCASGSGPLAWWRIRHSSLATSAAALQLRETYRRSRLSALIHEQEIKYVFSLLRAESIEPVLVKGWAIARRYPDPALRPYGDIDLCVRPDQFMKAQAALKCLERIDGHYVDLHDGFGKLEGRPRRKLWDELFQRSQRVDLGDEKIRLLSDEDHLRVLCLHLLRSGAWRPLWLCDVALALETRKADFNWDICLSKDRRQAEAIACTIELAQQLLGAQLPQFAIRNPEFELPGWLVPAVLRQWNRCANPDAVGMALPTLLANLNAPKNLFREVRARWDNPVRSTVAMRGRFNNWPRLPYQLGELFLRSAEVPKQLRLIVAGFSAHRETELASVQQAASLLADG